MTARRFRPAARLVGVVTALAGVTVAPPARSSEFVLVWDAPPECPAGEVVRRAMIERLGAKRRGMTLKANATVTKTEAAFRVQLHTLRNGQRGFRELAAPTCEALVEAISVIVALAVDPPERQEPVIDLDGEADDPESGARAASPVSPSGGSAEERAPSESGLASLEVASVERRAGKASSADTDASAAAREGARLTARPPIDDRSPVVDEEGEPAARAFTDLGLQGVASLAGSVESGALPGLGFGLTARGGMRLRRFRIEAALSRWFARQSTSAEGRGTEVDGMAIASWACFRAVPAHTAAVPRLRSALPPDDSPAIEAGPCVGAELGTLNARSFGVSDPSEGHGGYWGLGGALRLGATAADWLSLDVRFEALRVMHRPEFQVENLGVVYEPRAWSLRAALGAEAYFP